MATVTVKNGNYGSYLYIDYSFSANPGARTWSMSASLNLVVPSGYTFGPWDSYYAHSANLEGNGISSLGGGTHTLDTYSTSGNYNANGDAPSLNLTWAFNVRSTWGGYYEEYGSITATGSSIGPDGTPPTGLTATISDVGANFAMINVSISSYGSPSGSANRYIEAAVLGSSSYGSPYRYATATAATSAKMAVTNYNSGSLVITPNTTYYYGGYATNTVRSVSTVAGQFTTLPAVPVITATDQGHGVIEFAVTHDTEGSAETVTEEYSTDGGTTWIAITGGAFTLTLSAQTTVEVRRISVAGVSSATITVAPEFATAVYISIGNKTTLATKVYGSVPGRNIVSAETNSAALQTVDADAFGQHLNSIRSMVRYINDYNYDITSLSLKQRYSHYGYALEWNITPSSSWIFVSDSDFDSFKDKCRLVGLNLEWDGTSDVAGIPVVVTYSYDNNDYHKSKKIIKIYASVEGKTALTYEDLS